MMQSNRNAMRNLFGMIASDFLIRWILIYYAITSFINKNRGWFIAEFIYSSLQIVFSKYSNARLTAPKKKSRRDLQVSFKS